MAETISKLSAMGYERVDMIEGRGQFAVRGAILDIYPLTREYPYRLEFLMMKLIPFVSLTRKTNVL